MPYHATPCLAMPCLAMRSMTGSISIPSYLPSYLYYLVCTLHTLVVSSVHRISPQNPVCLAQCSGHNIMVYLLGNQSHCLQESTLQVDHGLLVRCRRQLGDATPSKPPIPSVALASSTGGQRCLHMQALCVLGRVSVCSLHCSHNSDNDHEHPSHHRPAAGGG